MELGEFLSPMYLSRYQLICLPVSPTRNQRTNEKLVLLKKKLTHKFEADIIFILAVDCKY